MINLGGLGNKQINSKMEKVQSLELQLAEVEMLQSMFPNEMAIDDPAALSEIQNFVEGKLSYDFLNSRVGITLHLKADNPDEQVIKYLNLNTFIYIVLPTFKLEPSVSDIWLD